MKYLYIFQLVVIMILFFVAIVEVGYQAIFDQDLKDAVLFLGAACGFEAKIYDLLDGHHD